MAVAIWAYIYCDTPPPGFDDRIGGCSTIWCVVTGLGRWLDVLGARPLD